MLLKCKINKVFFPQALITLSLFHFLIIAEASNKVGNGGDVIQCQPNSDLKITTQLLDFYEVAPEVLASSPNPYEFAATRFKILSEIAPKLAEHYSRRVLEIKNEIEFKKEIKLVDVEDSKHLVLPLSKECSIEQIAIKKNDITSFEKKFLFNQDIWDKLDTTNQAGLLTHEIIYEHFYKLGEEDSVKVRKFNSFLYRKKFTKKEFWKFINELKIPIYP